MNERFPDTASTNPQRYLDLSDYTEREHWPRQQLVEYQARALQVCRAYAYAHSPFYRQFHQGLMDRPLQELPVLTKASLMEHFDEVVTDRAIHLADIRHFLAETGGAAPFLARYRVMVTSGSTGLPGVFLLNQAEGANALAGFSRFPAWAGMKPENKLAILASDSGEHMSSQLPFSVDGHLLPRLQLSASEPVEVLVQRLNDWQPDAIAGYPSILRVIAQEQRRGHLWIRPRFIFSASETLIDETRGYIESTWDQKLFNIYGTTEAGVLAAECAQHQGLHLFEDQLLLEVVDHHNQPVPPGRYGEKVLLTTLFRYTQPLIRYEISDRVGLSTLSTCPCGCPFALIDPPQGRTTEVLRFAAQAGGGVSIHPILFHQLMDGVPASGWQIVQGKNRLRVLLSGVQAGALDETLRKTFQQALSEQGADVPVIEVEYVATIPRNASGKVQQIVPYRSDDR